MFTFCGKDLASLTVLFYGVHEFVHIWDCECKVPKTTSCRESKFWTSYRNAQPVGDHSIVKQSWNMSIHKSGKGWQQESTALPTPGDLSPAHRWMVHGYEIADIAESLPACRFCWESQCQELSYLLQLHLHQILQLTYVVSFWPILAVIVSEF